MGKRPKRVFQKEMPAGRHVVQDKNPEGFLQKKPAWNFASCDKEKWAFTKEEIGDAIWTEILPFFQSMESMTWGEILVAGKKQCHSIDAASLNGCARKRLEERYGEQDALVSLRLSGIHRMYGYIIDGVFNVLWYDPGHGDNDRCVCRSHKKHT